jgi:hypothetical protein
MANSIALGLTRSSLEPTIYHTQGELSNHYTTDTAITTTRKFYNIEQQGNPLRQVKKGRPMWLHVEQELLVLPEHPSSYHIFSGVLDGRF